MLFEKCLRYLFRRLSRLFHLDPALIAPLIEKRAEAARARPRKSGVPKASGKGFPRMNSTAVARATPIGMPLRSPLITR